LRDLTAIRIVSEGRARLCLRRSAVKVVVVSVPGGDAVRERELRRSAVHPLRGLTTIGTVSEGRARLCLRRSAVKVVVVSVRGGMPCERGSPPLRGEHSVAAAVCGLERTVVCQLDDRIGDEAGDDEAQHSEPHVPHQRRARGQIRRRPDGHK